LKNAVSPQSTPSRLFQLEHAMDLNAGKALFLVIATGIAASSSTCLINWLNDPSSSALHVVFIGTEYCKW
jgi:hypothetical protein